MDKRRRDNRGRLLKTGESQEKKGRYRFSYYRDGKRKTFYSWKLLPSDKTPPGKKDGPCLRAKIADYRQEQKLYAPISPYGCTVLEIVKKYVWQKRGLKKTTQAGLKNILKILENDDFGKRNIKDVKLSDAQIWLIQLAQNGRRYSTVFGIRGVLRLAFQLAVEEDVINKNPFDFKLSNILKNDSQKRMALTEEQRDDFLNFILTDKWHSKYYDAIYILFHTGMRISEFCGLTLADIDMKEGNININHQLQRLPDGAYSITSTKTSSGTRIFPMTPDVYVSFFNIIQNRKRQKIEPIIDGYSGFLFFDKKGMPFTTSNWGHIFSSLRKKYNQTHDIPLPPVSPHICRHTYCTSMARTGISPHILQYLMGHYEISTTLDVYTHFNLEDARREMKRIEALEKQEE